MIHNFFISHLIKLCLKLLLKKNHEYQVLLFKSVSISLGYIMDSFQTAYLSKIAESAFAAHAKIRPPCTLKHRVQQEYNSLLVNVFLKAIRP